MTEAETINTQETSTLATTAPLKQLKPLVHYPPSHPAVSQITASVKSFGILRPIITSTDHFILDGNKLYTALVQLNYQYAPIWIILEQTKDRDPTDYSYLWNIRSILNAQYPYSTASALEPLLDALKIELMSAVAQKLPEHYTS